MLDKFEWDQLAERILHCMETGSREFYDESLEVPVANYLGEERWRTEMATIFHKQPLFLCFSEELREPGSYLARSIAGLPILLTRNRAGELRGFLNKCRHRGAPLTGEVEASGSTRLFVCPFHAWSYDLNGKLVGVPCKDQFGTIPDDFHALVPIMVEDSAGMVWGTLAPGAKLDLQAFLGGMLPMLEKMGFGSFKILGERKLACPNWKITMDGYIENYHFNVLHRETFGTLLLHDYGIYDEAGPHTRNVYASPGVEALRAIPKEQWNAHKYLKMSFNIFPNCAMGHNQVDDMNDAIFMMAQILPLSPTLSETRFTFLSPRAWESAEDQQKLNAFMDFAVNVVDREDYWMGFNVQHGLNAISDRSFILGRMERMVQNFESNVNRLVEEDSSAGDVTP